MGKLIISALLILFFQSNLMSQQGSGQQEKPQQQSFISNIVGTTWNIKIDDLIFSFVFGQGTLDNQPYFEGYTWRAQGANTLIITQLNGKREEWDFNSMTTFTGRIFNKNPISGTKQ